MTHSIQLMAINAYIVVKNPSKPILPDLESDSDYARLPGYQQSSALFANQLLALCNQAGYIDPNQIKRVCDFGAGYGGATFALQRYFDLSRGAVTAVERDAQAAKTITDSRILPKANVIIGDGIHFLEGGPRQYDLVTAFMLGPDTTGNLTSRLLNAAQAALHPGGKLLICSDLRTMHTVKKVCHQNNIQFDWIEGIPSTIPVPSTAIISFKHHVSIPQPTLPDWQSKFFLVTSKKQDPPDFSHYFIRKNN